MVNDRYWFCKCPGGFNTRLIAEPGCPRCGETPTPAAGEPPGRALMGYQRVLALSQRLDEERRRPR